MAETRLPESQQESILAALVFDDKWGAVIAGQVTADIFDGPFREIADATLSYRTKFRKAPGRTHIDDILAAKLYKDGKPTQLRRILFGLSDLAEHLNYEYVVGTVQDFIDRQTIKSSILQASARFDQGGENVVEEVKGIMHGALRYQQKTLEAGIRLSDPTRALAFLERKEETIHPPLGISVFDRLGLSLAPKELTLFIAPKGRGKSWFGVHCGRQTLLHRGKVVHITLELREDLLAERYLQACFSGAHGDDRIKYTALQLDDIGRFESFKKRYKKPAMDFDASDIRSKLKAKIKSFGLMLGRVVIKEFPSGTLTISRLNSYLDHLELAEKFVPTVLIVDYPDLMQVPRSDFRLALGNMFVALRGVAGERNLAVVAPTQANRSAFDARQVKSRMVSEDITKVNTADAVITYSSSPEERARGLARLHLAHSRRTRDNETVLITQNYAMGQFVLESVPLNNMYWEQLGKVTEESEEDAEE